jgi:hypothetical protein
MGDVTQVHAAKNQWCLAAGLVIAPVVTENDDTGHQRRLLSPGSMMPHAEAVHGVAFGDEFDFRLAPASQHGGILALFIVCCMACIMLVGLFFYDKLLSELAALDSWRVAQHLYSGW